MSLPDHTAMLDSLRRAVDAERLAHSFLILGSPRGGARDLALALAQMLYCTEGEKPCGICAGCRQVAGRMHPDVYWLEPEKKSRIIPVGDANNRTKDPGIRFRLLEPLSQTAYAGGWKVGIILWADRMREQAANALLKTLEEPPRKTLLILVTDEPQNLLPTIVSRCQRLNVGERERPPDTAWMPELETWLAESSARGPLTSLVRAVRLKELLERIKAGLDAEELEDEEGEDSEGSGSRAAPLSESDEWVEKEVREARVQTRLNQERVDVLRAIQYWQRDLLACRLGADASSFYYPASHAILTAQAAGTELGALQARIRAVEQARQRFDNNLNDLLVLESLVQSGI
ncbi:MAG: hypothetical protein J5I99_11060 [Verrucomicrobia bacterium]|nr:hypothetical protein [Verrucomicrobiota bacterium]